MLPFVLTAPVPVLFAAAPAPDYAESLQYTLTLMETERHKDALKPLKIALTVDRNEPMGALTLGTLYLQSGSPERAAKEFARARRLAPTEPLAVWGSVLSELAAGRTAPASALLATVNTDAVPAALFLRDYLRFVSGDTTAISSRYADVSETEPDALRLELAAFLAKRSGNNVRAESLLSAFLTRPEMRRLQEDSAVVLLFDGNQPAQGCAGVLPSAIGFPEPTKNEGALSGRTSLLPPDGIALNSIGYVAYSIDGGYFSATTNYSPFTTDWNTLRVPNGDYTLRTQVFDHGQTLIKETARTVTVQNANAVIADRLTSTERSAIRSRLFALLTPRASRKAAHFALAERAVAKGDTNMALSHVESTVAIDPVFHNARETLRQFNRQVAGPCEGIWKCQTNQKLVALTFDDGPNAAPNRTPALLSALKAVNVPATFFVVGKMVEKAPDLVQQMFRDGHEIANHSYSHPNLTYLTAIATEKELCRTSVAVRDITGVRPRFYRPPGGNFNTATVDAARALGMAGAYWTVDGIAYENPPIPRDKLTQYVLQKVRPGSIVLLHNAPDNTIAVIGDIVRGLRAQGYQIVTLSELVKRTKPVVKAAALVKKKPVPQNR